MVVSHTTHPITSEPPMISTVYSAFISKESSVWAYVTHYYATSVAPLFGVIAKLVLMRITYESWESRERRPASFDWTGGADAVIGHAQLIHLSKVQCGEHIACMVVDDEATQQTRVLLLQKVQFMRRK